MMKRIILIWSLLAIASGLSAQIFNPVSWDFSARPSGENEMVLTLRATIDPGWHVYSQHLDEGGPIPTNFKFTPSSDYELKGGVAEVAEVERVMDPEFGMEVPYFSNGAVFEQTVPPTKTSTA